MTISPREQASCLSILFFFWLRKLIAKGWKRQLQEKDLYDVLHFDHAADHGDRLEKNWYNHLRKCAQKNKQPSLRWVLFTTFGSKFLLYGFFGMLEECVFRTAQVVSLGILIEYTSERHKKDHSASVAYIAAGGIFVGTFCYLISFNWSIFSTHHVCTHMRIAVSSLIYRKTLRLSQATLRSFSTGQLITMLSSDVYRLDWQDLHMNYLWIAPIQLCVVLYLLFSYYQLGYASLSGLGLLVVFGLFQYINSVFAGKARNSRISATNHRLKIISEIMNAFYSIKLYAWENVFFKRGKDSRKAELKWVKRVMILRIMNASLTLIMTKITVFVTLLMYIKYKSELDAISVFITVILYEQVRVNLSHEFARGAVDFVEVSITAKRVTEFLLLEEKYVEAQHYEAFCLAPRLLLDDDTAEDDPNGMSFKNVSCKWFYDQETTTLEDITFDLREGKRLAVVGPTGSGKSSLLAAILGELPIVDGKLTIQGRIAYTSQNPWLFPGTIRQNIIFGREFNQEWYNTVLDLCALQADVDELEDGDQTKVIRAGLSSGQKARLSLARAVYSNSDIYLLDDPLSNVDARLQRHILEKCIRGALKHKAVILVTHQLHFLESTDEVALLLSGKITAKGTFKELQERGVQFSQFTLAEEADEIVDSGRRKSSIVTVMRTPSNQTIKLTELVGEKTSTTSADGKIPLHELEEGDEIDTKIKPQRSGFRLLWAYFQASSSWFLLTCLLLLCIAVQFFYTYSELYLEKWTEREEHRSEEKNKCPENPNPAECLSKLERNGTEERTHDTVTYCGLMVGLVVATLLRSVVMFDICMTASYTLFCQLLNGLLHSKAKYLDMSSAGHGINRFSKDMIIIDELLPITLYEITGLVFEVLGALTVIGIIKPWSLLPSGIFLIAVIITYRAYHNNAANLKRLEANSRSPIYAHTAKTLEGLVTVRAFEQERIFLRIYEDLQDNHTAAWYLYVSINRWLSMIVDCLALLLIIAITLLFVYEDNIVQTSETASKVGLAIGKVLELSILMQFTVIEASDTETEMISVERIIDYSKGGLEKEWEKPDNMPPPYWPRKGNIRFENVSARGNGGKVLLSNVSLDITEGEKVGIVGRSGSGKTTFFNTLYRILEPFEGKIIIDDVNILEIGLHDLRRRLSVIPQSPLVFSGTIRFNLDPLDEHPEHDIWDALEHVQLFEIVKQMNDGLDTMITESNWQLSPGQKQLLCLARVLLQNNQIICLDQALNNLDSETYRFVYNKIQEQFATKTVLMIAHRLQTIMDNDKIMVIDGGKVVDYGHPYTLIKQGGALTNLIMHLGQKNAEEITKLAKENDVKKRRTTLRPGAFQ